MLYYLSEVVVLEPTSAGLYLECRLLDMRTGVPDLSLAKMSSTPAVIYTPDFGCSFTSGYESTVKRSRR